MSDHTCSPAHAPAAGRAFATMYAAIYARLARMARAVGREIDIACARRSLMCMPDHMLKDIGIDRNQIDRAVRFGREQGRRYL